MKHHPRLAIGVVLGLFVAMGLFTARRLELSSGMAELTGALVAWKCAAPAGS